MLWLFVWGCSGGSTQSEPAVRDVPLPRGVLRPGQTVTADDLLWIAVDADLLPEGALESGDPLLGRTVTERLIPREFIRRERLAAAPAGEPAPVRGSLPYQPEEEMAVPRAARELPAGTKITEADLEIVKLPRGLWTVMLGVPATPEGAIGRTVCERVFEDEFIRIERLDQKGSCPGSPSP